MATPGRRSSPTVARTIRQQPYRFDFFQAVRLLERIVKQEQPERNAQPVGDDAQPSQEVVRFRASASRTFPPGEIDKLKARDPTDNVPPFEMTVGFMGLYGPAGVLPSHYTQMVIDQSRKKDYSLRDFLDVFNHRVISMFYRSWAKYRLPIAYERRKLWESAENDTFSEALFALVGMATPRMRDRLEIDDETIVYFSGHFAHQPRNACGLQLMLGEYSGLQLEVQQFRGQWLYLESHNRSLMPTALMPAGQNCQLGKNMIVGDRIWSVESGFRIRIGPIGYRDFSQLMPGEIRLVRLAQLIRLYVGPYLDFDFQLILKADEVPELELRQEPVAQLGLNTWLFSGQLNEDPEDAVFKQDGAPTR